MPNRDTDWLHQAERDLEHARLARQEGHHDWACFAAQRSVPADLVEKGRVLDNFYIPARYPNGHPEGSPFQHYGPLQSREAIAHAGEILGFARAQMA